MRTWSIWIKRGEIAKRIEVTAESVAVGDTGALLFWTRGEIVAAFGKNSWEMMRTK